MRSTPISRWWAGMAVAALLCPVPLAAGERFHARFDPSPDGPVPIFLDDFESGGTCDWVSTEPCTLYILRIPPGTDLGNHGFPAIVHLQVGTVLHIVNDDSTPHRIHANNTIGLVHQASSMGLGQEYVGTVTQIGQDTLYCHDHPGGGSMIVMVP